MGGFGYFCSRCERVSHIELDPHYCDVIVRRMADAAKIKAVHAATGQPFAEIEHERAAATAERQPDREGSAAEEVA